MKALHRSLTTGILLFLALVLPQFPDAVAWAQSNPVPLINQPLVPDAAAPGGPGFTLTVNGTGFVSGSVVNWNGTALATTFVSGSQLTATVPASDIATAGTASVTVLNPGVVASNVVFFDATAPAVSLAFGRSDSPLSPSPQQIATADFNGDGKLDLAITSEAADGTSGELSVLLGNGDGTFGAPTVYSNVNVPTYVAVGDFNGDGKPDLAVSNFDLNGNAFVAVLLGNGDGTFGPPIGFAPIERAGSMAIGDINGDGKLDVAVASGNLSILLGNGDGTFQAQALNTSLITFSVTAGDFNGDGKLDVAVGAQVGAQVSVYLGNGDGTFQSPASYAVGGQQAYSVTTADFNSDGKLDLVVANSGTAVSVLLGNGDGTFQPYVPYSVPQPPVAVLAGDFNGDGKLDLATGNGPENSASVLLGNGDGTFQSHLDFGTGLNPLGIGSGDFNGDGKLDLVSANNTDNSFSVLLQQGAVMFSPSTLTFATQLISTSSAPQTVTLTNSSGSVLTITGFTITDSADFSQTNTCGPSVPAGGTCSISVTFAPTAQGLITATVTANTSAGGASFAVSGTGTESRLSPTRVNYGSLTVGTSKASKVTLTNTGSETLTIGQVFIFGADKPDFSLSNGCGKTLAPKASCAFTITFKPTAQGSRNATLSVNDTGTGIGGVPQSVPLHGNGT